MSDISELLLWVVVGAVASAGHLAALRRAVNRLRLVSPDAAQKSIMRGFGLRIALMLPVLLLAARSGLYACIGLVCGWTAGRAFLYLRYLMLGGASIGRGGQG